MNAVKEYLFKSCSQSGFCNRNRHYATEVSNCENFQSPYSIDSIKVDNNTITGVVFKHLPQLDHPIQFPFEISILEGNFRFKLTEKENLVAKNVNPVRYNETEKWAFKQGVTKSSDFDVSLRDNEARVIYGDHEVLIQYHPIMFVFKYAGKEQLRINDKQFLNIEHRRTRDENDNNMLPQESDFNMFSDSFQDSKFDTLPLGPESIGLDFTLLGFSNLYGIPEHADSLLLRDTSSGEPYRLYNVDIFEYEPNSRLPMYGSIPLVVAAKPDVSIGIFWLNSADTYVDIHKSKSSTVHWMSENGFGFHCDY